MRKIVPVVAGPFATERDAIRWGLVIGTGHLPHRQFMRKTRRGWYILARVHDVVHAGNKAWRKRMKALV